VAIARAISERTTVRQNWIADHLNLKERQQREPEGPAIPL